MSLTANKPLRWLLTAIVLFTMHGTAYAQATRTWVSGVGDDVNPCSRTAPCKTFAGAISKTASGGEIDTLDPGGFGAVTITKSITIQSDESKNGGILVAGTNGITVNCTADPSCIVAIRGLVITGMKKGTSPGTVGISFLAGGVLKVENCYINGFAAGNAWGISMAPTSGISRLYVSNSTFAFNGTGSAGGGIGVKPTGSAMVLGTIDSSHFDHNTGFGISVSDNGFITIQNVHVEGSQKSGVAAFSVTNATDVMLTDSVVADSGWAGTANDGAILSSGSQSYLHISNNLITNSTQGIRMLSSGKVYSFGNNKVDSNTVNGTVTAPKTQL
jgi:hypothetical protein